MDILKKIPPDLKVLPQWVCWREEVRDGKPTKVPKNPKNGGNAKADTPGTWGTFAQAVQYWKDHKSNGIAGVGFEFSADDPYSGIDLDKCRDAETGEMETWAREIITRLNSYTEVSPSGGGVHVLLKGNLPPGGNRKGRVEMYSRGRYFTMTGLHLEGTPATIEKRQAELAALHGEIFGQAQPKNPALPAKTSGSFPALDLSDRELIDRAHRAANGERFARLWRGDLAGHPSPSEATAALLNHLVFWCGRDPERIDRLFRQSGLMRPKWDRAQSGSTWGALEIQKAMSRATEVYSPGQAPEPQPGCKDKARGSSGAKVGGQDPQPPPVSFPGHHLTDMGNARRLVDRHGQDLHYCFPLEKWLHWEGRKWQFDDTGEVDRRAKDIPRMILEEAAATEDKEKRALLIKHSRQTEAEGKRKSMVATARSEPGMPVLPEKLDRDKWLFNVLNGTLDLRTAELRPHRREDLVTKLAPVQYDRDANYATWWEFLQRITGGSLELMDFLKKAVGYALTGSTREQCIFFLYGLGANGKSTFLEVLQTLLGDYAKRAAMETFLAKKFQQIPNDLANMRGARLVTGVEAEAGRRLAESLIKELSGGDVISARFLFSEFFEFKPEFKIFLATNHKPIIPGTDHAIWRRIRLIPFTVQIPEPEQDKDLPKKLKEELPGILNWAIEGCLDWQDEGLTPPQAVQEATQGYREEMDVLGEFIAARCIVAPGASALSSELYKVYTAWAEENGEKRPLSQTAFGTTLTERGFLGSRGTGGRAVRSGIGLREE